MADYRNGEVIPVPLANWLRGDLQWIKTPGAYQVACPTCGDLQARCNGVHFAEANEVGWRGDGQVTRIQFACSQDHHWRLCFGADHEQTWCWVEGASPDSGEDESGFGSDPGSDDDAGDDDSGYP